MTLSDLSLEVPGTADQKKERKARGVGVALSKCLRQALESGRLTCGIVASATLLQECPDSVLLCLLPAVENGDSCDHGLHINHTLITAFCTEHSIRFLRVSGTDLRRVVSRLTDSASDSLLDSGTPRDHALQPATKDLSHCATGKPDVTCVLIQRPGEELSFEDEVVLDYYDDLARSSVYPKPILSIPG